MLDTSASIGEAQAEDTDTSSDDYTQGQFVIIKYEGKPYVGQIVAINKEGLEINCMNQIGKMKNGLAKEARLHFLRRAESCLWHCKTAASQPVCYPDKFGLAHLQYSLQYNLI